MSCSVADRRLQPAVTLHSPLGSAVCPVPSRRTRGLASVIAPCGVRLSLYSTSQPLLHRCNRWPSFMMTGGLWVLAFLPRNSCNSGVICRTYATRPTRLSCKERSLSFLRDIAVGPQGVSTRYWHDFSQYFDDDKSSESPRYD